MGGDFNDLGQNRSDAELRATVDTAPTWQPDQSANHRARSRKQYLPNAHYVAPPLNWGNPTTWHGKDIPPREWLVDGWVPMRQVTMLSGDGGVGKTLLAQQLLTAAATGTNWLGMPARHVRALGVFCEDDDTELARRQKAINDHMGLDFNDLEDMQWASRVGLETLLIDLTTHDEDKMLTPLYQTIHNATQDFGAQLLVLDSLHDLFGGNENYRSQAQQFINKLRNIALDMDGAVVLCAHPSRSGLNDGSGTSGSTAWNNAVRSRFYLHRSEADDGEEPDENARVISRKKSNYARRGEFLNLTWNDGVLIPLDSGSGGMVGTIERRNAENVFLELLGLFERQNRPVSDSVHASNFAPKMFAKQPWTERQGFKRPDFERAMEALFSADEIKITEYGPPAKRRRRIIRSPHQENELDGDRQAAD